MLLILLSASNNKVLVRGTRTRACCCEVCQNQFHYVVQREAEGQDRSLFSWTQRSALRKAEADAHKNLDRVLDAEDDAVPCPQCGWTQMAMIAAVRKQSYAGLKHLALAGFWLALLGLIFATIAFVSQLATTDGNFESFIFASLIVCGLGTVPAVLSWLLRAGLNSLYNPNRNHRVGFDSTR